MGSLSLLYSPSRVETPYIKVTIGNYTFGVYQETDLSEKDNQGFYTTKKITYPNYVQSLNIQKINGQVNTYTLTLSYPIRPQDDPNYFEKVFSSVSNTRKIIFSYGDMSLPGLIYKNEEALITKIQTTFSIESSVLTYTISAVSSANLAYAGSYNFPGVKDRPSNVIRSLLNSSLYGLKKIFPGMTDDEKVKQLGLIPGDDQVVEIQQKTNISVLDYINYLVSCMIFEGLSKNNNQKQIFYVLTIHDDIKDETLNDIEVETLGGAYFKINKVSKYIDHADAYEIDIGYPSANVVLSFSLQNNENYSIYYDWQSELDNNDYVKRIDDNGRLIEEYSPTISSKNDNYITRPEDKVWWSKVTQYPISASITLKGLLRPAVLMQYVKLNILFYGNKHIASGTYIITKQFDSVNRSGYRTTLELTRVSGEEEFEYDY